jgi:hypothetical protein
LIFRTPAPRSVGRVLLKRRRHRRCADYNRRLVQFLCNTRCRSSCRVPRRNAARRCVAGQRQRFRVSRIRDACGPTLICMPVDRSAKASTGTTAFGTAMLTRLAAAVSPSQIVRLPVLIIISRYVRVARTAVPNQLVFDRVARTPPTVSTSVGY